MNKRQRKKRRRLFEWKYGVMRFCDVSLCHHLATFRVIFDDMVFPEPPINFCESHRHYASEDHVFKTLYKPSRNKMVSYENSSLSHHWFHQKWFPKRP